VCRLISAYREVSRCFSKLYKGFCVLLGRNFNNEALAANQACKINIIETIHPVDNGSSIIDTGVWRVSLACPDNLDNLDNFNSFDGFSRFSIINTIDN